MELLEKLTSVVTEHFCEFSLQSDHSASSLIESSSRQQEQFNQISIAICQQLSELSIGHIYAYFCYYKYKIKYNFPESVGGCKYYINNVCYRL